MELSNRMQQVIRKASAIGVLSMGVALVAPDVASAFDWNTLFYVPPSSYQRWSTPKSFALGTCTVHIYNPNSNSIAYVILRKTGDIDRYAGGSDYQGGLSVTQPSFAATHLAACLSVTVNDILDLRQDGADSTYANDNLIGFSFTVSGTQYLFKLGSDALTTTANAPTGLAATSGNGQVSIAFTMPSSNGGAAITDYQYELDGSGTWVSAITTSSPVVITGLTNGTSYSIKLRAVNSAGNGTESTAVTTTTPSPASAFEADKSKIQSLTTSEAMRGLGATLSSNVRMTSAAQGRFVKRQAQSGAGISVASNQRVPFDIDGTADAANGTLSTKGTFSEQWGNEDAQLSASFMATLMRNVMMMAL